MSRRWHEWQINFKDKKIKHGPWLSTKIKKSVSVVDHNY